MPSGEVIRVGDPVAAGVLAAGLLPGEIVGVRGAVAQRVHARRHPVGIGRVHRGGDEAQRIGDAGLVSGVVIGVARAVAEGVSFARSVLQNLPGVPMSNLPGLQAQKNLLRTYPAQSEWMTSVLAVAYLDHSP